MKKNLLCVPLLFLFSAGFARAEGRNLTAEMKSSYASGFYPGVVRFAEEILRTERDSLAAFRASVYEGEALFRMGRVADSLSVLQKHQLNADSQNAETVLLNSARFFWIGRGLYAQGDFSRAQNCFFAAASVFRELGDAGAGVNSANPADYFALSMLFGGRCYFYIEDFANSIPLFEYVVANGAKFAPSDYEDACLRLAQCYNSVGDANNAQKCVRLVSQLEGAGFDDETAFSLLILKGEAQENLREYKNAYDSYCAVIENAPSHLAASAMQKAYAVSSTHRVEVGSEAGAVLLRAEGRLSEYPDLLSEFWTRFAVDAFGEADYQKSLSYFSEAEKNASDSQKKIAAVYRAEIAYLTAGEKSAGSGAAIEILSAAKKEKSAQSADDTKNLDETISLSLARYNAYLKNWKDCERFAREVADSESEEIERNAVYWLALAQYEAGGSQKAVTEIENYNKKLNGLPPNSYKTRNVQVPLKITDKSILNLYAKSLAKQGKYHDADVIFYSLGEKNQLDNDGRLDYSRTLLIAGHYVSTKEQAAKASGDEAVYLSALASFNQRRWGEAERGFAKVSSSQTLDKDFVAYAQFYAGYAQYQQGDYAKSVATLNHFIEENPLHPFCWSAQMTIARSASFVKNDAVAVKAAQNAVKTARNESEKNEAILLSAGILSDSKKYDDALAILSPYTSQRTSFGYEAKYRSAEILVQKGDFARADSAFAELAALNDKSVALISEESAYRRAEIAYSQGDFAKSAELFEEYGRRFAGGRFHFAAIYFSADSMAKSGDETRAILRYLQIVDSKAETSYRYGSEKNLVDLYARTGDTESAISMANRMIDEYGEQARNDGMAQKVKELKQNSVWNANSEEDRIKTAEQNLAKQKNDPAQSAEAAKNAIFLADRYRSRGENKKSALMYLDAAKYARQAGNDESAARSFYGAVESFDAAGLYADAKATFTEMKKLYPQSAYTKDAEKIAGDL